MLKCLASWLGGRVALLTSVCMYLSYEEEKKKITGSSECT